MVGRGKSGEVNQQQKMKKGEVLLDGRAEKVEL
jgi:hypothetical protein